MALKWYFHCQPSFGRACNSTFNEILLSSSCNLEVCFPFSSINFTIRNLRIHCLELFFWRFMSLTQPLCLFLIQISFNMSFSKAFSSSSVASNLFLVAPFYGSYYKFSWANFYMPHGLPFPTFKFFNLLNTFCKI